MYIQYVKHAHTYTHIHTYIHTAAKRRSLQSMSAQRTILHMHTQSMEIHTCTRTYIQLQNANLSRACLRNAQVHNTTYTKHIHTHIHTHSYKTPISPEHVCATHKSTTQFSPGRTYQTAYWRAAISASHTTIFQKSICQAPL